MVEAPVHATAFRADESVALEHVAPQMGYPASSVRFDWAMGLLAFLLIGGVILDGWSHAHRVVDQSFLTPWHAMLYSMVSVSGIVLGAVAIRNRLAGYPARRSLPYGYMLALVGVALFAAGGVFDMWWHTRFGIEPLQVIGLISPSHLVLAVAGMMGFSGPIRSIARQYGRDVGGWRRLGPMIVALLASLTALGFFTAYAQPIEDGFTSASVQRERAGALSALLGTDGPGATFASGRVAAEHGVVGLSLAEAANAVQALLLAGLLLIAVRRWRVPFGTFAFVLTLFALAMATQTDAYYDAVPALATGLLADAAIALFRERVRGGTGFYAFAFALPAVFFATYLGATILAGGTGTAWGPVMLVVSPLLAGAAGLLVAFCYEPPIPAGTRPG